jgi:hypothetical protein
MRIEYITESIYEMDPNEPNNPEVLVQGYGRLKLKQIEAKVAKMFAELAERSNRGDWESVQYDLNKGLVQVLLKAISDTYDELETIRKRGGKNSRGIEKR